MNGSTTIDTILSDLETGETRLLVQTVRLTVNGELVYSVEGGKHEIRVNAQEYISTLRELTGL